MAKKPKKLDNTIAQNKKARFDFHLETRFEAGLALQGWEVKSLRAGRGQLTETYVIIQNNEAWLIGMQIQPIPTISTHCVVDPQRTRKLLLNRRELNKLIAANQQKGKTIVALSLYWKQHLVKCEIAIGTGKKKHDKRETEKERDWDRQKRRVMQQNNR
ncbi:MAG: SsrA-binding protein SmpB [Cellvibrionaceae bacterium]|nr:SsrA-binding protein SmpB [Cellvibrionaceae bacterium]